MSSSQHSGIENKFATNFLVAIKVNTPLAHLRANWLSLIQDNIG